MPPIFLCQRALTAALLAAARHETVPSPATTNAASRTVAGSFFFPSPSRRGGRGEVSYSLDPWPLALAPFFLAASPLPALSERSES